LTATHEDASALRANLKTLEVEKNKIDEKYDEIQDEMKQAKLIKSQLTSDVNRLKSEKAELEESNFAINKQKLHLNEKVKSLVADITRHATEKIKLEYEMKKQEADKIRVEKENEALKEVEATFRADANVLREELNRVKSELVVLKSTDIHTDPELASLTQERDALEGEVARLQELLHQAETVIDHVVKIQSTRGSI
jgi:chromosome segregation ATPase